MLDKGGSICVQKLSTGISREVFNIPTKANFDLDSKTLYLIILAT